MPCLTCRFRNRQPQAVAAGGQNQEEASTSQQHLAAVLRQAQEVTPAVSSLLRLAMQEHAPTLPDIMARVPHLVSYCMLPLEEDDDDVGCDIRVLRCVNKELSRTAMQMVTQCSLQLGEGVSPDQAQMVCLLSDSGLKTLQLTISTTSGEAVSVHTESCTPSSCQSVFNQATIQCLGWHGLHTWQSV